MVVVAPMSVIRKLAPNGVRVLEVDVGAFVGVKGIPQQLSVPGLVPRRALEANCRTHFPNVGRSERLAKCAPPLLIKVSGVERWQT